MYNQFILFLRGATASGRSFQKKRKRIEEENVVEKYQGEKNIILAKILQNIR